MKFLNLPLLIFAIFMAFSLQSNAQNKEDLLTALNLVFSDEAMEPGMQNELSSFLLRTNTMNSYQRTNIPVVVKLMNELRADDFYDFDQPVRVFEGRDQDNFQTIYGVSPSSILNIATRADDDVYRFVISTYALFDRADYRWTYLVAKDEDGEWSIQSKDVSSRISNIKN